MKKAHIGGLKRDNMYLKMWNILDSNDVKNEYILILLRIDLLQPAMSYRIALTLRSY